MPNSLCPSVLKKLIFISQIAHHKSLDYLCNNIVIQLWFYQWCIWQSFFWLLGKATLADALQNSPSFQVKCYKRMLCNFAINCVPINKASIPILIKFRFCYTDFQHYIIISYLINICKAPPIAAFKTLAKAKFILTIRGNCTPNQKLACFVLLLKIINTFLKNNICILKFKEA